MEAAVAVPDIPPGFDFTDPEIYRWELERLFTKGL